MSTVHHLTGSRNGPSPPEESTMGPRTKKLYWQVTALLLAAHFAGWAAGLPSAMGLTLLQILHFGWYGRDLRSFEVQIRAGYLLLLVLGAFQGWWFVHVIQFIGVNAFIVADYCPLARLLALAPWNRRRPLTLALVREVFLSPPVRGSILDAVDAGRTPTMGRWSRRSTNRRIRS